MTVAVTLKAKTRISRLPTDLVLEDDDTVLTLIDNIAQETKIHASRIRLTVRPLGGTGSSQVKDTVVQNSQRVSYYARNKQVTVYVRDLGPQIAWRTVFVIEYLGPLLIHPLYFFGQKLVYGETFEHTLVQKVVYAMVMLHFLKRELETIFVHKFSLATMPVFNLFKNCAHYWLLSGVLIAYFVYAPPTWQERSVYSDMLFGQNYAGWEPIQVYLIFSVWVFAEIANFVVHLNLASLRKAGSTERKIPYGFGFDRLSSPNYFYEAWSWLMVSALSQNWSVWLFFVVGSVQMYVWAVKKHKRYLKEFPDYPKDRKAFIPYIA